VVPAASWLVGETRAPTAACTPDRPHNHAISVEREVDVDGDALQEDPAHSRDSRVARSDPRECGDQVERAIEIRRKSLDILTVGHPPVAFAKDVATRSGTEPVDASRGTKFAQDVFRADETASFQIAVRLTEGIV
jgi:hypothetical protein